MDEHQYNPGYWVNRLPPGFPPKKERRLWLLYLFRFVFYGAVFAFVTIVIFFGGNHLHSPAHLTGCGRYLFRFVVDPAKSLAQAKNPGRVSRDQAQGQPGTQARSTQKKQELQVGEAR